MLHGDYTGGEEQRRAADRLSIEQADIVAKGRSRTYTQVTVDIESHIRVSRRCEDVHPLLEGLRVTDWPDGEAGGYRMIFSDCLEVRHHARGVLHVDQSADPQPLSQISRCGGWADVPVEGHPSASEVRQRRVDLGVDSVGPKLCTQHAIEQWMRNAADDPGALRLVVQFTPW